MSEGGEEKRETEDGEKRGSGERERKGYREGGK